MFVFSKRAYILDEILRVEILIVKMRILFDKRSKGKSKLCKVIYYLTLILILMADEVFILLHLLVLIC